MNGSVLSSEDLELGELVEYAKHAQYTSYITSYTSDGLKINGLLTKPTSKIPVDGWPAIVFIHGYIPPTLYKTTENYGLYVDVLAKAGFVVFILCHGSLEFRI